MNIQELFNALKENFETEYPGMTVDMTTVKKNNKITKTGAVLKNPQHGIAPIYYLEEPLERINAKMQTLEEVIEGIKENYKQCISFVSSAGNVFDYIAPENFIAVAINYDQNSEALENMPYIKIDDVAITIRNLMPYTGSVAINDDILKDLKIDRDEALEIAISNSVEDGYEIIDMLDILAESYKIEELKNENLEEFEEEKKKNRMCIVSNKSRYFGAAGIFISEKLRKDLYEKFGEDYFVMPSSVHEAITVSVKDYEKERALNLVRDVNKTTLDEEFLLSNNVFVVGEDYKIRCVEA